MNRRDVMKAAPALALFGVASRVRAAPTADNRPFLHVLDGPIPDTSYTLKAGDMVLVLPGAGPWDDMHLLRDGRFAAVQVTCGGDDYHATIYGTGETMLIPKDRASEYIAGRVDRRIRLDRGRWIA